MKYGLFLVAVLAIATAAEARAARKFERKVDLRTLLKQLLNERDTGSGSGYDYSGEESGYPSGQNEYSGEESGYPSGGQYDYPSGGQYDYPSGGQYDYPSGGQYDYSGEESGYPSGQNDFSDYNVWDDYQYLVHSCDYHHSRRSYDLEEYEDHFWDETCHHVRHFRNKTVAKELFEEIAELHTDFKRLVHCVALWAEELAENDRPSTRKRSHEDAHSCNTFMEDEESHKAIMGKVYEYLNSINKHEALDEVERMLEELLAKK